MFENYFKVAFRNLKRNKIFSLINIAGLAVGITCFIILALFAFDEYGFDTFNKNADRIYRVYVSSDINGNASNTSKTACPLGSTLKNEFPEVENFARIGFFGQYDLRYKDKVFREGGIYTADSTYFQIFSLPLISGNPKTALVRPNSIVISERAANKYFGDENPLGKKFIVNDTTSFTVTAVMKNYPKKSHFDCDFLISMSTYPQTQDQNWLDSKYTTYVLFKQKINPREFEKKMERLVNEKVGPQAAAIIGINLKEFFNMGNRYGFFLQPLNSIYLYSQSHYNIESNTEWGNVKSSNIYFTYVFIAIGSFILLIAVFNFMNLTTAKSEGRAKEVGIRKTLGSDRTKLIWQFITESTIICFISVVAAYVLLKLVLPSFNNFVGREISFNLFDNFYAIPLLLIFTLVVGFLAGSYPAFYLSAFPPSHVLKSKSGKSKSGFRNTLVIIQFAISITLIIGTLIIKNQLDYILNKDLGFNKDKLIVINNASNLGNRVEAFKQEIAGIPNVLSSTNSSLMFQSGIPGGSFQIENAPESEFKTCQFLDVDYDFAKTYQIEILKGRYFSKNYSTDTNAIVLNESALKIFRTENPIGKILYNVKTDEKGKVPYTIIGVVKNFNYESLHQVIRPLALHISPVRQAGFFLTIRVRTEDYASTIGQINQTWRNFTQGRNFNCTVLNDNLENMYTDEIKIGQITTLFSLLAIFIACLGLFGLAAFVTEKRIKEIGIRKALGASEFEIVLMLTKDFTKWVVIANLIAWPVSFFVMNKWLQNFAYRIELNWIVFVLSGLIALAIAIVTVSLQAVKAALTNPVNSLKYE
jgi:putative ABC transport system permease protein